MNAIAAINCPYCIGNTTADRRKTCYLYSTDTYWCARCKRTGLISEIDPSLLQGLTPTTKTATDLKHFKYNNTGNRFSVCKQRYSDANQDVFQIKLVDGSLVGHYYRFGGKQSKIEGIKGFCYREQFLKFGEVYRLVEGPYDCIYPNDVCVLGYPNTFQVNSLKWIAKLGGLILCPDGDVWKSKDSLKRWLLPFQYHKNITIEYVPNYLDPDECPQDERRSVEFKTILQWLEKE